MKIQGLTHLADESLDDLLHWLEREPADDPTEDLVVLAGRLRELPLSSWSLGKGLLALKGGSELAFDIGSRTRARLQQASLPLEPGLRAQAEQIGQLLFDIAATIADILPRTIRDRQAWASERERCLVLCVESLLTANMTAGGPPPGLWRLAHQLGELNPGSPVYSLLLALAAAAPESLTAREQAWLADFLAEEALVLPPLGRPAAGRGQWWVAKDSDVAPVALSLRTPEVTQRVIYFDFNALIEVLNQRLRQLQQTLDQMQDRGEQVEIELFELDVATELVPGLAPLELLVYLRNLRERWLGAALRTQQRRQQSAAIELCIGLRRMWELASGHAAAERVSSWELVNESAGGYAVVSDLDPDAATAADTALSGIEVGVVLGLRTHPQAMWSVCVVRWVRAPTAGRIELGLQLLAPRYQAVRLAFRASNLSGPVPALALPPMEPLRRHSGLLAPAGSCSARRFVLMRDGRQLYVAQARVLGVDLQTSKIELFRYELDPNPI